MVRTYKRKTQRGSWSSDAMERAVDAVQNGGCGCMKAATEFGVPQSTLERRVRDRKRTLINKELPLKKKLGPYKTVFTLQEEATLSTYIKEMESRHFELTYYDLRKLAFQLAEKYHLKHNFPKDTELAGKDWLAGFLKRNPELSVRMSAVSSQENAGCLNRVAVYTFFFLLAEILDKYQIKAHSIYNTGEVGITVIPGTKSKVIRFTGRKQEEVLIGIERGNTVTAELCFSANGSYMPPTLIYPLAKWDSETLDRASSVWLECHQSGWMQPDIFLVWFQRFVEFTKATKDTPVLLLLDSHFTHTKNINVLDYARNNGVILLCYPANCSHRLEALEVAFLEPLTLNYDALVSSWLQNNPDQQVSLRQVTKLFGDAYIESATKNRAKQAFRKTGIWPYNPDVFADSEFIPLDMNSKSIPTTSTEFHAEQSTNHTDVKLEKFGLEEESTSTNTTKDSSIQDAGIWPCNEHVFADPLDHTTISEIKVEMLHEHPESASSNYDILNVEFRNTGIWTCNPNTFANANDYDPLEIKTDQLSLLTGHEFQHLNQCISDIPEVKREAFEVPLNLTTPSTSTNVDSLKLPDRRLVVHAPIFKITGPKYKLTH